MTSSQMATTRSATGRGRLGRLRIGLLVGLGAATMVPAVTHAQTAEQQPTTTVDGAGYVTTTLPAKSLDVSGFSPECIRDAPFIRYTIVPKGFTPTSTNATLAIKDRNGNLIETKVVNSFSGTILWPGASVGANGNTTDWPGWKLADDGVSFIPDPSDSFLREGLTIEVTVETSTATATVTYPPATSPCANPPGHTPPATTVPGGIPRTGSDTGASLMIGAAALLAGTLFLAASRRRNRPGKTPTAS